MFSSRMAAFRELLGNSAIAQSGGGHGECKNSQCERILSVHFVKMIILSRGTSIPFIVARVAHHIRCAAIMHWKTVCGI